MCGIAGYLGVQGRQPQRQILQRMIAQLRHRGPDGCGIEIAGPAGLAHARLSIIDIEGGRQPMSNEDGSLTVVFNGEIFNYVELREELLRRGHQFATSCDTEVILHLYEDEGPDCVKHFNGQWAFALWDHRKRQLFLSRDRLGVRPLFYTFADGQFVFGSELKAILAHPDVRRRLDFEALNQIFTYWVTLPPRTLIEGIEELRPGCSLLVEDGRIARTFENWRPDFRPDHSLTEEDAACQLLELLKDATRLRLRSDVPVGAYLSGGLDSTVTTALIRNFTDADLRTFSISFEDQDYDESSYQQEASKYLDTEHSEMRCRASDIGRVFPDVIWHTEKPLLRTAPAPMYLLSRLVRDSGYKVVITGEGADEVLGGYDIFKEAKVRRFCARQPDSEMRPALLRKLYPYIPGIQAQPPAYLRAFFHARPEDLASPFFSHEPRWELTSRAKTFFSDEAKAGMTADPEYLAIAERLPAGYREWDLFAQAQFLESDYLLPGYILSSQGDRVAMAHSVEGRFPFLDYRVVEFGNKLPSHFKMRSLTEKYLLKRATRGLIPPSITQRFKQPYRAPESCSFFKERLDYVDELLEPAEIRRSGVFRPDGVSKLVAKARAGQLSGVRENMAMVGIISTQLWMDRFMNRFSGVC